MIRASSLLQARECPGSVKAQEGLPEITSSDADSGTRIHAAIAGGELVPPLTKGEEKTVSKLRDRMERIVTEYAKGESEMEVTEADLRYGVITGHPDWVGFYGERAIVIDFKSGWKKQDAPAVNAQLRGYAYLVLEIYDAVEEVVVAIIPANFATPTPCRYTRAELPDIEFEIRSIIKEADSPAAKRIPGDVCRYCRAYATSRCPETCREIALVKKAPLDLSSVSDADAPAILEMLSRVAIRAEEGKKAMLEHKLAHPDAWPSLEVVPGANKRSVPDAEKAYGQISDFVDPHEFASVCKVTLGSLEELLEGKLREKESIKGRALAERVKSIIEPVVVLKRDRPRLQAVKKLEAA